MSSPPLYTKLNSKVLMGCNKSIKYFDCEYMTFMDKSYALESRAEIEEFLKHGTAFAPHTVDHKIDGVKDFISSKELSANMEGLFTGNNTGTMAVMLCVALGFKRIYLCGMDCRYGKDWDTHFHEGYGRTRNERVHESMATFFETVGEYITKHHDVELFNVSYDDMSLIDPEQKYYKFITYEDALC
jgi:hypothetical protein